MVKAPEKPADIKPPSDFDTEQEFVEYIRKQVTADMTADKDNRTAAQEDLDFAIGNQWPDEIRARRERARKPTLTYNRGMAFVAQVTGNRRLNETVIKVVPDNGGTKAVANVREGLIRSIQKTSRAKLAYDKANENQVICGIGNFQVLPEENTDDVFVQDIRIKPIPNALAVIWDRMSIDPTGADAKHAVVNDMMPTDDYKRLYPWATVIDALYDLELLNDLRSNGWIHEDTVRIASFWRMRTRKRMVALMLDGSVQDITDDNSLLMQVAQRDDGTPIMREADRKYAELCVTNGIEILEPLYELPISRVPVLRVPGWEINVGDVRHRFGLIRFLKDPIRMHNYWRSVQAEKLMMSPKAKWIAPDNAVQGLEKQWREAHLSDDPLLVYKGEAGNPPTMVPPVQMEPALVQEAGTAVQDIRDISNLHEASLGQQSNEVSGRAIIARQRVGELGTIIYQDNLNAAIEQAGMIINELIPLVYDTPRIVKIIGPDEKELLQLINATGNPASVDITLGKYSVSVATGPSYVTKRIEAAESMLNMVNAMPNTLAIAADKIVEAQDWPGAEEIARRLRQALPPGVLAPDDLTPQQQQEQAQAASISLQQAALAKGQAEAELRKSQATAALEEARVAEMQARTRLLDAQRVKAIADAASTATQTEVDARSTQLNDALSTIELAEGKGDKRDQGD
jgi:hypothetical protein